MSATATRESSIEALKDILSTFPLDKDWVNIKDIGAALWVKYSESFNPNIFCFSQTKLLITSFGVFTSHIKQGKPDTWIRYKNNKSFTDIVFPVGINSELLASYPVSDRPDTIFCAPEEVVEEPKHIKAPTTLMNHIKVLDKNDGIKDKHEVKLTVKPFKYGGELRDIDVAKKLIHYENSANSRKLEFNLSFKTMKKIMNTKKCFFTGVPFTPTGIHQMSVDRVDASKGYIEGNVVPCTIDINNKKTNLTVAEILLIAKKIMKLEKAKKLAIKKAKLKKIS
jgi:hypothetical protein